jgi:hypothetical protein
MEQTTSAPPKTSRRTAARAIPSAPCVGLVSEMANGRYTVTSGSLTMRARRAASCLLEPAVGDSVACLQVAPDENWILAILTREEGVGSRLSCAGPAQFHVEGSLTLEADGIELGGSKIALRSDKLEVTADEAVAVGREFRLVGSTVKLIGTLLSTVFDRVGHFSKHHQRTTEGVDRVQANYVEQDARQILRLSGQTALITGETVVKARGGQIHLG